MNDDFNDEVDNGGQTDPDFVCWFCHEPVDYGYFSEFDTPLHGECLFKALKDADDTTAKIIAHELFHSPEGELQAAINEVLRNEDG